MNISLERVHDPDEVNFIKQRRARYGPWNHPRPEDIPAFGTIEARQKAYIALFDAYCPWMQFARHERLSDKARDIRERLWDQVRENQEYQAIFTLFSNVLLMEGPLLAVLLNRYLPNRFQDVQFTPDELRPFQYYLDGARRSQWTPGVWSLIPSDRERMVKLMHLSSNPVMRQIARRLDELFLRALYGGEFPKLLFGQWKDTNAPEWNEEALQSDIPQVTKEWESKKAASKKLPLVGRKKLNVLPATVDVIVVGAGPSGIVLAHHFYSKGQSVALIEKGALMDRNQAEYSYDKKLLHTIKGPELDQEQVSGQYAQVVGGGAWAGGTFGDDWKQLALKDNPYPWPWTPEDANAESPNDHHDPAQIDDAHGLWALQQFPLMEFGRSDANNIEQLLKEGASEMDYELLIPPAFRYASGNSPLAYSNKMTVVESLFDQMVEEDDDADHKRFFPIQLATVERVLWAPAGRLNLATGVEFKLAEEGGARMLKGKRIILCAGAIGTPAILARSYLPRVESKNLGRHFGAWPEVRLMAIMPQVLSENVFQAWSRRTPSMRVQLPASTPERPVYLEWRPLSVLDIALMGGGDRVQKFQRVLQFQRLGTFVVQAYDGVEEETDPARQRHLLLDKQKPEWIYRPGPKTLAALEQGVRQATSLLLEAGAKEVVWDIHIPLLGTTMNLYNPLTRLEDLEKIPAQFLSQALWAPIYTNVISGTVPRAVVENNQRVVGMRNLYIADSSLAPYAKSPDMIAPLMLMAKKLGMTLKK